MKGIMLPIGLSFIMASLIGCAGIKVIRPGEENKNAGTKALDFSEGTPKIVLTHSCTLESVGNRFNAVGKTEEEARKEVVAKCRDKMMISFCDAAKASCVAN